MGYSCLWIWRQEAPSLRHLRGQDPSAAEARAAGQGWEESAGVKDHRGYPGGVARGMHRECACACLCTGAFYVNLVNSLYYSYIHRNKNVARGGGREI